MRWPDLTGRASDFSARACARKKKRVIVHTYFRVSDNSRVVCQLREAKRYTLIEIFGKNLNTLNVKIQIRSYA
jgi:hypothetical protein